MPDQTLSPREFITKAMADAKTTFDVFDAIVGRMDADAAKIAELEAKGRVRTRELITWIQVSVGPHEGMLTNLAAKRKIEELEKELAEASE